MHNLIVSRRPGLLNILLASLALALIVAQGAASWGGPPVGEADPVSIDPALLTGFEATDASALPMIVVHEPGRNAEVQDLFEGLTLQAHTLDRLEMSLVHADLWQTQALAASGLVRGLWADHEIEYLLDDADGLVGGASQARDAFDVTGEDVGVLVIDTGVDALHPDLVDRVVATAQPTNPLEYGFLPDTYVEGVLYNDALGHGTHVSGIVAGTGEGLGAPDPNHQRYVGMAPGADLVVWAIPGLGSGTHVYQALQGFEYALENQERFNLRVITNSWGVSGSFDSGHPINQATLEAYEAGMAVVFAAGNSGQPSSTNSIRVNLFSVMPWTLSIAAADKDATLASFSSQGSDPDASGRCWEHPDLTAPGVSVMAAKARAGALSGLNAQYAPPLFQQDHIGYATHYQYLSGTSMAAPMVAGALALLFEANPELAPDQAYDILLDTAGGLAQTYDHWQVGAGMLDVPAAITAAVATTGTLDDFLLGVRDYDDPDDPCANPLNAHLTP